MRVIDQFLSQIPEKPLFHYTTPSGLLGILRENSIWASSAYHLNDAEEFKYAVGLIVKRLEDRLKNEQGPNNVAYGNLLETLETVPKGVQVFIASFSEEGDLLSQWLSYSGANGYALAVDAGQVAAAVADGFTLVRCVYDADEQIRIADAFIDAHCTSEPDAMLGKALVVAAAIKHPGFAKEAEWRLVKALAIGWHDGEVLFRPGRNGIVPYMKVPLSSKDSSYVPNAIHIGPNTDMHAATVALETFLSCRGNRRMGSPYVHVVASKTPYRP